MLAALVYGTAASQSSCNKFWNKPQVLWLTNRLWYSSSASMDECWASGWQYRICMSTSRDGTGQSNPWTLSIIWSVNGLHFDQRRQQLISKVDIPRCWSFWWIPCTFVDWSCYRSRKCLTTDIEEESRKRCKSWTEFEKSTNRHVRYLTSLTCFVTRKRSDSSISKTSWCTAIRFSRDKVLKLCRPRVPSFQRLTVVSEGEPESGLPFAVSVANFSFTFNSVSFQ